MTLAQINGINTVTRFTDSNTLVGDVVSRVLIFAVIAAGLYFLFHLITSGFSFLTSAGDPAKLQTATREITNALLGLVIVISVFFAAQLIETILGINLI